MTNAVILAATAFTALTALALFNPRLSRSKDWRATVTPLASISVAYYLNLLGAFSVSLTDQHDPAAARMVTTAVLLLIGIVGWARGFSALERLEEISVSLKLAIICGLLLGLAIYLGDHLVSNDLILDPPQTTSWGAISLLFGLMATVQSFAPSRYLSEDYDPSVRITRRISGKFIRPVEAVPCSFPGMRARDDRHGCLIETNRHQGDL